MERPKEELALIEKIEEARKKLNASIDERKEYDTIYQYSVELDHLIEQYLVAGYPAEQ
ncbi:MAG: aspartyl-phosphate phosphatase Spo0E family protein [Lachnospiraceae bacterium]|nr:aspartyl-phosphate phosphatase Spo0E family protein [Lachnospiraceae bacterium]